MPKLEALQQQILEPMSEVNWVRRGGNVVLMIVNQSCRLLLLISQYFLIGDASFFIIQPRYLSKEAILYLILAPSGQAFLNGFPIFAVNIDEANQLQIFLQSPIVSVQVSLEIVLVVVLDLFGSSACNRELFTFKMCGNELPLLFAEFPYQGHQLLVLGLVPIDPGLIGQSAVPAVAHLRVSSLNLGRDFLKSRIFVFAQSKQKSILLFRPRFLCLLVSFLNKILTSYHNFLVLRRDLALVFLLDGGAVCKGLFVRNERREFVGWTEEVKKVRCWAVGQVIEHHGPSSFAFFQNQLQD